MSILLDCYSSEEVEIIKRAVKAYNPTGDLAKRLDYATSKKPFQLIREDVSNAFRYVQLLAQSGFNDVPAGLSLEEMKAYAIKNELTKRKANELSFELNAARAKKIYANPLASKKEVILSISCGKVNTFEVLLNGEKVGDCGEKQTVRMTINQDRFGICLIHKQSQAKSGCCFKVTSEVGEGHIIFTYLGGDSFNIKTKNGLHEEP